MAVVYLAHDRKHDRKVALKVIRPDLTFPGAAERFSREIRLAARLQHPHILAVHDSGESDGQLWYTMPYVEGESLRDRLDREKRLPVAEAIRIAREAAQALEYAHQQSVIHRDIKPENLLLTTDGSVLVADFGIARALARDDNPTAPPTSRFTEIGMALGTPTYMAPEQAMGEGHVDGRADVYALGIVLYEMLAGEPPFTGSTPGAIMSRSLTQPAKPLTGSIPGVTPELDATIAKALAKNADDRFGSAHALATSLEQAFDAVRVASSTARTGMSLSRNALIAIGAFVVLSLSIVAGFRYFQPSSAAEVRLAVLPFENIGGPGDAYFADGIADELRGKLTTLTRFRIIARSSSDQYRRSAKSPKEIARELGVDYLLNATVRWSKASDGSSRVQVVPELVRAETGEIAWQQPFDANLSDIFRVQSQIASLVAGAVGAALGTAEQQRLARPPTTNIAAYDLYLRSAAIPGTSQAHARERIALLERAVALDSNFVVALATLSSGLSGLYQNGTPDRAIASRSIAVAERAVQLAPDRAEGFNAVANYHYAVTRDADLAEKNSSQALQLAPHDPTVLATAAKIERQTGKFDVALEHLREAQRLNPRSITVLNVMQTTLLWLRRYGEALAISDSLLLRRPGDIGFSQDKAMAYIGRGDLASAKNLLRGLSPAAPDSEVVAYFSYYWDMYWVLDDAQQARVLKLSPALFDGDRAAWATTLMQVYWLRGDKAKAREYARISFATNTELLRDAPNDAQRKVMVGLALAYLGKKDSAIAEGRAGAALSPLATDKINGPYYQHQLARIYLLVGEKEKALDQLEPLLKTPYYLSPGWLRLDPTFAELRGNPRYERLIGRVNGAGP